MRWILIRQDMAGKKQIHSWSVSFEQNGVIISIHVTNIAVGLIKSVSDSITRVAMQLCTNSMSVQPLTERRSQRSDIILSFKGTCRVHVYIQKPVVLHDVFVAGFRLPVKRQDLLLKRPCTSLGTIATTRASARVRASICRHKYGRLRKPETRRRHQQELWVRGVRHRALFHIDAREGALQCGRPFSRCFVPMFFFRCLFCLCSQQ
jgi:hypothetical protein